MFLSLYSLFIFLNNFIYYIFWSDDLSFPVFYTFLHSHTKSLIRFNSNSENHFFLYSISNPKRNPLLDFVFLEKFVARSVAVIGSWEGFTFITAFFFPFLLFWVILIREQHELRSFLGCLKCTTNMDLNLGIPIWRICCSLLRLSVFYGTSFAGSVLKEWFTFVLENKKHYYYVLEGPWERKQGPKWWTTLWSGSSSDRWWLR